MVRVAVLAAALSCLSASASGQVKSKVKQKQDSAAVLKIIEVIDAECVKNAEAKKALKGDALTQHLVRAAAGEALKLPEAVRHDAFLTGLGIGLDRSNYLAQNPFTKATFGGIESPAAAKTRQANIRLKQVSMRDRNDWTLHWALSVGLTSRLGPQNAEMAGLAKEGKDLLGSSGWSFTDVNADLSGIEFAERIRNGKITLAEIERDFTVSKVLASPEGLDDSLTLEEMKKKYAAVGSPAMKKEIEKIRRNVVKHFDEEWPQSAMPRKK